MSPATTVATCSQCEMKFPILAANAETSGLLCRGCDKANLVENSTRGAELLLRAGTLMSRLEIELRAANHTITDLRNQLKEAKASGGNHQ